MARQEVDAAARFRFADALARGVSADEAARLAGYSRMHGYRLRKDPAFVAEVAARRLTLVPDLTIQAVAELRGRSVEAVTEEVQGERRALARLIELMDDPDATGPQVSAAKAVVTFGRRPPAVQAAPPATLKMLPVEDGKAAEAWLAEQESG